MIDRRRLLAKAALAIAIMPAAPARAQKFPDRRITMMVGFGAGGMSDVSTRILARKLEQLLGATVLIENKTGAGGIVAIGSVAQMPADGHTLVTFLTDGPFTAAFQGKPLNLNEWAVIGGYMPQERVLFAAKSAPFNTAHEMMAYAKSNPITASDGGSFWSGRVIEAFAKKMGGHATMAETGTGTPAWTAAKGGDLKIIATLTPGGLARFGMPDVPTWDKLGADFVTRMFYGYAVRAETPADRIERMRAAFKQAVEDPEVRAQMTKIDLTPEWIEPKAYEATLRQVAVEGEKLRDYLKK
jgi:tripartite-type tricarboxylate transporter receptor subunit TctC